MKIRRSQRGQSLVEILVGAAIGAVLIGIGGTFLYQMKKSESKISQGANFEQMTSFLGPALADKRSCNLSFLNGGLGASLIAGATSKPYANINKIQRVSGGVLLSVDLTPGNPGPNEVKIIAMDLEPLTPAISVPLGTSFHSEIRRLVIEGQSLVDGKILPHRYEQLIEITVNNLNNAVDPCQVEGLKITTLIASRGAYVYDQSAHPHTSCSTLSPPVTAVIPAPGIMNVYFRRWCEIYGGEKIIPGFSDSEKPVECDNLKTDKDHWGQLPNSSYVMGWDARFPYPMSIAEFTAVKPTHLGFAPAADPVLPASEIGRCWVAWRPPATMPAGVTGFKDVFAIMGDDDPKNLNLGCNRSKGWAVTSCTTENDGTGGSVDVTVRTDPKTGNSYCSFNALQTATPKVFNTYIVYITTACTRVEQ